MTRKASRRLWTEVDKAAIFSSGRTRWVSGGGYWIAHERLVPPPPGRVTIDERPAGRRMVTDLIARFTPHAIAGAATVNGWWQVAGADVVAVTRRGIPEAEQWVAKHALTLCGFRPSFWHGMTSAMAGHELRVDFTKAAASWWSPQGYPVAILLGHYQRPQLMDGAA